MDTTLIEPPEERRWWQSDQREDTSAVIGLQSGFAAVALATAWAMFLVLGLMSGGVERTWLYLVMFGAIGAAFGLLLFAPGTPAARWATVGAVIAEVGSAAAFVWAIVPVDRGAMMPFAGATAVIGALFCLRGRVGSGWVAFGLVTVVLGALGRQRADALHYVTEPQSGNLGILVMMTVFAAIIGPRAEQIFALRRQATRESKALAVRAIRDHELARLDDRVRPLLRRIADGDPLDETELVHCRLVEAQLRDRIRAPGLDVPAVADAVWAARERHVRVVLLDDRGARGALSGLDGDDGRLEEARAASVATLADSSSGDDVTVRLLPEGRQAFATITVASGGGVDLRELGATDQRV
ncbi:MAG: FUSC family protein [Gordonia sp. (in: high G+C Gram-positive bacteria)]|jgi:hypothetical protein|nr:FUSC family protein [Gordonia sp. (in: high G+C Gram-positive bacteria)]